MAKMASTGGFYLRPSWLELPHWFQNCLPVAFRLFLFQVVLPPNILPRQPKPVGQQLPTERSGVVLGPSQAP